MPENTDQEKTEKPTTRKLQKARKEGNVPKSMEIPSVFILLSSLGVFLFAGSWMFLNLSTFMRNIFENIEYMRLESASLLSFLSEISDFILIILMPLMITVLVAGIAGNIIQFGFMFTTKPFEPKISKFNPVSGLKKIVSLKSLVEVIKAIFKFIFIAGIAYLIVKSEIENFPGLTYMSVGEILSFIGRVSFKVCFYICLTFIALALIDYSYQRWQHEKNLRMTKQEVKDEAKQAEGDPKIKGRIRQIQLETARRRMMEQVPDADVVITNPTHLAIALKYEHEKMMAPKVIAKGAGYIAEKIKEIAEENNIPIVENKTLARTLFKLVDLGDFIPANLYRAVAEVLAYVYRLKRNKNNS